MRNFNFSFLGGMPWTQDEFDFLQKAYQEPIKAFARMGGDNPHIISGMVDTAGIVSDGALYYNGEVIPFTGGAVAATIKIDTYTTTLVYGDGTTHAAKYRKAASFGSGSDSFNYADLKTFQEGFGLRSRSGWKPAAFNASFCNCEYYHNELTGTVYVRGIYRHSQFAYTGGVSEMKQAATLPDHVIPSDRLYFRSEIDTHHTVLLYDLSGGLWTGDVCMLDAGGNISFSSRPLMGSPANPDCNYYFSYQL
jgi:hypothetical protein